MTGFAAALLCALALADAPSAVPAPLFPVVKDGKWGYVDRTGKVVVAPRFDAAGRFSEGLAPVRLGRQLGYADATGALVLAPEFEPADGTLHRKFSDGRAVVRKAGRYGRTGKLPHGEVSSLLDNSRATGDSPGGTPAVAPGIRAHAANLRDPDRGGGTGAATWGAGHALFCGRSDPRGIP
jgi:hypothetical protein